MMRSIAVVVACSSVAYAQARPELPPIPSFELVSAEAGYQDVRSLRIRGSALTGQNLSVRGYVTWAYDCMAALAKPGRSERRIRRMIKKNPSLCAKGELRLGATKDDARAILVVQDAAPIPAVKVGDYVSVTGTWKAGERGELGQLVFASLAAMQPTAAPSAAAPPPMADVKVPNKPAAKLVAAAARTSSLQAVARGHKALAARRANDAVAAYREATRAWDGNHAAWYALGIAHQQQRDWTGARAAWERAAALVPGNAQYQQWLGIAAYEAGAKARDAAIRALRIATKLDPKRWRAQYVLGRVYRDAERPRDAADALGRAIAASPREPGPYIALAELYRRWDHTDQAIAVATIGTAQTNHSEVWYVLGTAYDDKRQDDKAIEAFGKSLERRADNHKARFARGRALHRKGDRVRAKQDLVEFVKVAGPELDVQKQIAVELAK